jgi:hypothetical protein
MEEPLVLNSIKDEVEATLIGTTSPEVARNCMVFSQINGIQLELMRIWRSIKAAGNREKL